MDCISIVSLLTSMYGVYTQPHIPLHKQTEMYSSIQQTYSAFWSLDTFLNIHAIEKVLSYVNTNILRAIFIHKLNALVFFSTYSSRFCLTSK